MIRTQITVIVLMIFLVSPVACESFLDSLKNELSKAPEESKAEIQIKIAYEVRQEDPEKCIQYAQEALSLLKKYPVDSLKQRALYCLGDGYIRTSEYNKAAEYLHRSLVLARKQGNLNLIASIYNKLGIINKNWGNHDIAIDYFKKLPEIYNELDDKNGIAISLNNIGIVYRNKGNYPKALEYYLEAFKIREEIGDPNEIAQSLSNIGTVYRTMGDHEKALENYKKALKIGKDVSSKRNVSVFYNNIGNVYSDKSKLTDYDKALENFYKALEINRDLGNKKGISIAYINIGEAFYYKNKFEVGERYYDSALALCKQIDFNYGTAYTWYYLAKGKYDRDQLSKAKVYIDSSLNLAESKKFAEIEKDSYELLANVYSSSGEYKKSAAYFQKYDSLTKVLFSTNTNSKIVSLLVDYITEKKQKEIEILKKDKKIKQLELAEERNLMKYIIIASFLVLVLTVVIYSRYRIKRKTSIMLQESNDRLRESENRLQELNDTKDKFFSIIAHDLKHPLGNFRNLTKELYAFYDYFTDEEKKEHLNELNKSSDNLYNLLENLLKWALVQKGGIVYSPEPIDLKLIAKLTLDNLSSYADKKNVKVNLDIPDGTMVAVDTNMISTVIRNITSNAIKFTPENGNVDLYSGELDDFIEMNISDTGIGINEDDIDKLFRIDVNHTTTGTEGEKGTGLGLILAKEFVEKNGGEIFVESELNNGTTFRFTMPKYEE